VASEELLQLAEKVVVVSPLVGVTLSVQVGASTRLTEVEQAPLPPGPAMVSTMLYVPLPPSCEPVKGALPLQATGPWLTPFSDQLQVVALAELHVAVNAVLIPPLAVV
jgi:hypothetical protein